MLYLPFPSSTNCKVLLILLLKFFLQLFEFFGEFLRLLFKLIHFSTCNCTLLFHICLNKVYLVHVFFDYRLLSRDLLFKFIDREISTFTSLSPQIFDLFLNLWQVNLLSHLLVCLTLCLDSFNDMWHHHVKI